MASTTITLQCESVDEPDFRTVLADNGFSFREVDHAYWQARGPECVVVFYRSGKVVLQGKGCETWAMVLDPLHDGAGAFDDALARHPESLPAVWIGMDESGKGDYFGPLVVAAARVERERVELLAELGVGDSKKIADARITELAGQLDSFVPHVVIAIGPEKYNALYTKMRNVNRILAWAHATALEELLAKAPAEYAVLDRFEKSGHTTRALKERGRAIRLDQRPRAEDDPAVAAASIFARHRFNQAIAALSRKVGVKLAKGAGAPTIAAGHALVKKHGVEALGRVAKLHFKTTERFAPTSC